MRKAGPIFADWTGLRMPYWSQGGFILPSDARNVHHKRPWPASQLSAIEPLDWCRSLRDLPLPAMTKLVGHVLAMHINVGSRTWSIGVWRLAYESGTSKRTVIRALQELENLGLIFVHERGSSAGRQGRVSTYQLCTRSGLDEIRTDYEVWLKEHQPREPDWREPPEQVPA